MKSTWRPVDRDVPQWLMVELLLLKIPINKLFDGEECNLISLHITNAPRVVRWRGRGLDI